MPCSCDGITCSCGIPCFCPESTCGCTDCDNSTNRLCSLCNRSILYTDIIGKMCLCFRDHQTAESRNIEPDKSSIMHEGYILMYDYILNGWVPVIVQHSNLSPPTFQMVWICHQKKDYELLAKNGHEFVEISNPIGGGISHNVVYGNDPTIDMTYEPLEDVNNVPLNVDSINKPVGAVITDESFEENISNSTGNISNSETLDVISTSESLETENATNSIYTAGLKMYTLIDPDLRERDIVNEWLDSFILD